MVTRSAASVKPRLYIQEHIDQQHLSFEIIAARLNVSRTTVWRWANEPWRLVSPSTIDLANALEISPEDLFRPPGRESVDAILKNAPEEIYRATLELARNLTRGPEEQET